MAASEQPPGHHHGAEIGIVIEMVMRQKNRTERAYGKFRCIHLSKNAVAHVEQVDSIAHDERVRDLRLTRVNGRAAGGSERHPIGLRSGWGGISSEAEEQ